MLSKEQVEFFWEHGYLHIPEVFTAEEMDELSDEMNRLMAEWANRDKGWRGPWRKVLMDEETEKKSQLVAMHDLWYYSAAWMRAVTNPRLVGAMVGLLGEDVELHHSTMHVKPPSPVIRFPRTRITRSTGIATIDMSIASCTSMTPATRTARSDSWMGRTSRVRSST